MTMEMMFIRNSQLLLTMQGNMNTPRADLTCCDLKPMSMENLTPKI